MNNLESISKQAREALAAKDEAREKMLPLCRDSIRYSSNAIRAVHRREFDKALELLKTARELFNEAENAVREYNEFNGNGIIKDVQKEINLWLKKKQFHEDW